jgi:hypothetical protein
LRCEGNKVGEMSGRFTSTDSEIEIKRRVANKNKDK